VSLVGTVEIVVRIPLFLKRLSGNIMHVPGNDVDIIILKVIMQELKEGITNKYSLEIVSLFDVRKIN